VIPLAAVAAGRLRAVAASPATQLDRLAPRLAPLTDADGLETLRALAAKLPERGLRVIEARLGAGRSALDLAVRLEADDVEEALATGALPASLPRYLEERADAAPRLWLELDADAPLTRPPLVCLRLPPQPVQREAIPAAFEALVGRTLAARERRCLQRLLAAIPPGAWPLYAFDLSPRGGLPFRLELGGLDPERSRAFARRALPNPDRLEPLLALLGTCDRQLLQVDFGDEPGERLTLAARFDHQPSREPRWRALLERLTEAGLATREKAEAVLRWPGREAANTASEPPEPGRLLCAVSHVKVGVRGGGEVEGKGYLGWERGPRPSHHSSSPSA
jgi:hypothetical protein